MMRFPMNLAVLVAAVLFLSAPVARAVTFNDGQVHVIDAANSFPFDNTIVDDGPGESATTLNIVPGGVLGANENFNVDIFGGSQLNLSRGSIGGTLSLNDTSRSNISGGEIGENLIANHSSQVVMTEGTVAGQLLVRGTARLVLSGGTTRILIVSSNARAEVQGGGIQGGSIQYTVQASGSGVLDIRGGTIDGEILAVEISTIIIRGHGFNFPFGAISSFSGQVTGTLSDGAPLSVNFGRASTSTIKLVCPSLGFLSRSTPALAAYQNNYCENWTGVSQPADDLSGAGLELVNLTGANLSAALLIDADLTDADLSGADLILADLSGAILSGALYDESTLFPTGNTVGAPPWGLPGGESPWDLGMKPAPEPSVALGVALGMVWLAGLSVVKGSA